MKVAQVVAEASVAVVDGMVNAQDEGEVALRTQVWAEADMGGSPDILPVAVVLVLVAVDDGCRYWWMTRTSLLSKQERV